MSASVLAVFHTMLQAEEQYCATKETDPGLGKFLRLLLGPRPIKDVQKLFGERIDRPLSEKVDAGTQHVKIR